MRQQARTRSTILGVALLIISLIAAGWTVSRLSSSSSSPDNGAGAAGATATPGATPATPQPTAVATPDYAALDLSAKSIELIDAATGAVRFAREADVQRAPASTAKIVTALTVLRAAHPEDVVTIQDADVVDPAIESNMGLQAGDTVTVHDLLVGLLLPSGNDAANALARFTGERLPDDGQPPEQRFIAAMNAEAARLGMTHSHFVNPSGDDAEGQVVTAHDLGLATRALLAEPALRSIVALPSAKVRVGGPHARVLSLTNTNELVLTNGVYGVKTGTTEQAGECLIIAYRTAQDDLIAVILGSTDRYADARALFGLPAPPPPTPAPAGTPVPSTTATP